MIKLNMRKSISSYWLTHNLELVGWMWCDNPEYLHTHIKVYPGQGGPKCKSCFPQRIVQDCQFKKENSSIW